MALLGVKKGNTITILKPIHGREYERVEHIDVEIEFQSFFINRNNNLFIFSCGNLYWFGKSLQRLDTRKIDKVFAENSDEGCNFYYLSSGCLHLKRFGECEGDDVLIKKTSGKAAGLFITKLNEVCYWTDNSFTIFSKGSESKEEVPFGIKSVQPNGERYAIFDVKNNIYIFNPMRERLEGGLKSISSDILSYASSRFMPLVAVSTGKSVVVMDTAAKQVFKTIDLANIWSITFLSENMLLLANEKIWEHDFVTNESQVVFNDSVDLCIYFEENDGFHITRNRPKSDSEKVFAEEKVKDTILKLRVEVMRELFAIRKELDDIKLKIRNIEGHPSEN